MTSVRYSPDYSRTNPYQRLLTDALSRHDVDAAPVDRHDALMPLAAARDGLPDVLHIHWIHPFVIGRHPLVTLAKGVAFLLQLLALSLLGVRLVWTVHNVLEHDPRTPRTERLARHALCRLVDAVVVHCPAATDTVIEAYRLPERIRDRFAVVPHGHYIGEYPDDTSREAARDSLGLDDGFVFCFFGRVAPYKGVPTLLEAFRTLDDEARLVVAGNPTDEAAEEAVRSAAGDDDRVRLDLEFVPPERIQRYMAAADVVVLPFEDVLSSGSVVTAMSFGRPVLVPDIGCSPALFPPDGGFTYEPTDGAWALRAAMSRLARSSVDLDAAGRANHRAIGQFTWDVVAERTATVYTDGTLDPLSWPAAADAATPPEDGTAGPS